MVQYEDMPHVEVEWQPIETAPFGRRVLLWLEKGEKGNGEIAVGMICVEPGEPVDCYWTWGGPNAGVDVCERPTYWAPLPKIPSGHVHD